MGNRTSWAPYDEEPSITQKDYFLSLSVVDRNKLWYDSRNSKLKQAQQKRSTSGLEECTFQPQLHNPVFPSRRWKSSIQTQSTCESIAKFLSRMNKPRVQEQQLKATLDTKPGSGKIWKNSITIPKTPNLSQGTHYRRPTEKSRSVTRILSD